MSLELLKIQTDEGYSYSPSSQKLANFSFNVNGMLDLTKSYIVANVSVSNFGSSNANIAKVAFCDTLEHHYKPAVMFKHAKFWSESNPDMYLETRYVNRLGPNKDHFLEDVEDNRRQSTFGKGFDEGDANNMADSVFSVNFPKTGTTAATVDDCTGNVLIPLSDLFQDLGDTKAYPSMLFGTQRMELELEDKAKIINQFLSFGGVADDSVLNLSNGSFDPADDSKKVKLSTSTGNKNPLFVGQQVTILGNANNGAANPIIVDTTIANIAISDGSATYNDFMGNTTPSGEILITLADDVSSGGTDPVVITNLRMTERDGTDLGNLNLDWTINDMKLVLCKKNMPAQDLQPMLEIMKNEGIELYNWREVSRNEPSTDNLNDYFTISPNVSCLLVVPIIEDAQTLFSNVGNAESYRLTWDDEQTTDRDVRVKVDTIHNYDSLWRHKVELGVNRLGKNCKTLTPFLAEAQINNSVLSTESLFVMWEPIDLTPSRSELQVNVKAPTNDMVAKKYHVFQWERKIINV